MITSTTTLRPLHYSPSEEQAVMAVHETFWQSYAQRDLDSRFSVCAPDVTFFGTGQHEHAQGMEQYRAMNQRGLEQYPAPFRIDYLWKEVHVLGAVAWVECDTCWIMGSDGTTTKDVVRLTTILKKVGARWYVAHVHGSDPDYRLRDGEFMTHGSIHARNRDLERQVAERTHELREEKQRSEELLLNILPLEVAEELKMNGFAQAREFAQATILFTDFKGFTDISERLTPASLVEELNECYKAFDGIITAYGIEKIKTIGDSYMAAAGLPDPKTASPASVVWAAMEMQVFMIERKAARVAMGLPAFEMRVGIHTGPVVAGIVGVKKFAYDIWGDTVNTAARMESSGEVGQVNISEATYALVRDASAPLSTGARETRDASTPLNTGGKDVPAFTFVPRGKVKAKGKGELEMYFVHRSLSPLVDQ